MKLSALLNDAIEVAQSSVMSKRLAAIVHRRGDIIAVGKNRPLLSPLKNLPTPFSIHAELDALLDIRPTGAELLVVRVRRDGTWGNSRPCEACWGVILKRGILKVTYWRDGQWETKNLR